MIKVNQYTVEYLKELKRKHEKWVASLGEPALPGPMRLIPDPAFPAPKALQIITTGDALWKLVDGVRSFFPSAPNNISVEEQDLVDAFFDAVDGWMNVAGDLDSFGAKRQASRDLGEHIKALAEAGFLVGASERHLLLTGGIDQEPWPWRAVDIQVHSITDIQLSDAEGNPIRFDEATQADTGGSSDLRSQAPILRDPLLRRSVCAAGQPACTQVNRRIGLSGSDREFPALAR